MSARMMVCPYCSHQSYSELILISERLFAECNTCHRLIQTDAGTYCLFYAHNEYACSCQKDEDEDEDEGFQPHNKLHT
ncbi:hypothetical protein [Piscirickettsia salmonis]|uniref:hypothetical protein n=1 Tax=Piscirickettsia salmonis TaxID=1238 RepID=UPI0007C8855F|nr:hypothetical protein A0O36_01980 [Piscirickettsiaceae bacterium NZ-RLO1]